MRIDVEQQNKILDSLQQNQVNGTETKSSMLTAIEQAVEKYEEGDRKKSFFTQDPTYLDPTKEEKKTLADELEQNSALDAFDRKNQMAVLSHTTSEEDYKRMQEEGFSLESTSTNTIVTVTDEIKMELAKAGKDISCMGDDLSKEQIEAMAGNAAVAAQIENALKNADLPATEENIDASLEALELAQSLKELSDGAIKYMLDNELSPTIENVYLAEFSGSAGYTQNMTSNVDIAEFQGQVEQVISAAGLEVNEETLQSSQWLLEHGVPLTKENLAYLEELKNLTMPLDTEKIVDSIVSAVAEGNAPKQAMLLPGYTLFEQAQEALNIVNKTTMADLSFIVNNNLELTVENLREAQAVRGQSEALGDEVESTEEAIDLVASEESEQYNANGLSLLTAHRQLEEIRLAMTVEANYALLKRGISIDTQPLVQLVEELKNMENEYYKNLLQAQGAEATESNVALLAETTEKLQDMRYVPAYVLGIPSVDVSTINGVHENGTAMQTAMEKANESYETLMTAPRADLGDSIQKAFQNVDDILSDLGLELTEANQRAVRILGYNSIEITPEAIEEMKAADKEVQRVFANMTPAVVTEMIKQGINPLEMDFASINQVAEQLREEVGKDKNEKFSEYLYRLEANHSISEEEREAYIGIYRLIHQVTESDGAAIGALVNQGADLTLKNLLTAVRSGNKANTMDVTVDDEFGEAEKITAGNSITDQILIGYQTNCMKDAADTLTPGKVQNLFEQYPDWENMTPEQFAEALAQLPETTDGEIANERYIKQQLAMLEQCANSSEEIYQILEQYDMPNTMINVMALESMLTNRNQLFRKLFGEGESDGVTKEDLEKIKEEIIEDFGDAISEPAALAEMQETLGEVAENIMKTWIESDDVTSVDVREMRLMQAQLSMSSLFAKDEKYNIPVLVGDKVTNVSLKIVRGVDTKGIVDVMLESEMAGKIAATFQAKEEGISGFVATDNQNTRTLLAENMNLFTEAIQESNEEALDLRIAHVETLDLNHFSGTAIVKNMKNAAAEAERTPIEAKDTSSEAYQVQTSRLYKVAEAFIHSLGELI